MHSTVASPLEHLSVPVVSIISFLYYTTEICTYWNLSKLRVQVIFKSLMNWFPTFSEFLVAVVFAMMSYCCKAVEVLC